MNQPNQPEIKGEPSFRGRTKNVIIFFILIIVGAALLYFFPLPRYVVLAVTIIYLVVLIFAILASKNLGWLDRKQRIICGIIGLGLSLPLFWIVIRWDDTSGAWNECISGCTSEWLQLAAKAESTSCWGYSGYACLDTKKLAEFRAKKSSESNAWHQLLYRPVPSVTGYEFEISLASTLAQGDAFLPIPYLFDRDEGEIKTHYFEPNGEITLQECKSTITPQSIAVKQKTYSAGSWGSSETQRYVIFDGQGEPTCQIFIPLLIGLN